MSSIHDAERAAAEGGIRESLERIRRELSTAGSANAQDYSDVLSALVDELRETNGYLERIVTTLEKRGA